MSGSCFKDTTEENEFVFPYLDKGNVYNYTLVKQVVFNTSLEDKKNLIQFYNAEPKVLIRRIISRQDRLSVGYSEEKLVFKKDINPFIPLDPYKFSARFLLGVLASKFISYLYVKSSSIATKDDFRQTTLSELRALPIPNISTEKQADLVLLVDRVLENGAESSADIINQIDQLVYQLYNLTPEEIAIVEQSTKKEAAPAVV